MAVKLYKKDEFNSLFKEFSSSDSSIQHLVPEDIDYFRRLFNDTQKPRYLLSWFGKWFKWYSVVKAVK